MFTTLFALHTLLLIRLFCPVLSADSCICVVLSSDTFIMLGWGHAIQSVQFLMLVVQVALFQRSQRYSIQICKFVYLWVRRLLAYSHLSAVSSPTASLLWEVSTCVFYLLCCGVGLRSLSHGGILYRSHNGEISVMSRDSSIGNAPVTMVTSVP